MTRDILIALLGALTTFTGWYIWWTRRRFNEYRRILKTILERAENNGERVRNALDRLETATSEWRQDHERITETHDLLVHVQAHVSALREHIRNPPPEPARPDRNLQMQGQMSFLKDSPIERTAWQVLVEDIDRL